MWNPKTIGNFKLTLYSDAKVEFKLLPQANEWHEVFIREEFNPSAFNGSHLHLSTFFTNPCYMIDGVTVDTQFFIKVKVEDATIPFYPYVLKAIGIEKAKNGTQIKVPDCCLFPPNQIFFKGEYSFSCTLREKEGPFCLVLSTLYGDADSKFSIVCRASGKFSMSRCCYSKK